MCKMNSLRLLPSIYKENEMRFAKKTTNKNMTNYEGAKAYKISPEMELYTAVCTSSLSPKFYTPDDGTERIRALVSKVNPDFTAKLAIYARESMYLRSIPLVLCVELARIGKLKAETVEKVIVRVDEIVEIMSYYQIANERKGTKKLNKLSSAIYHGIKNVFQSGKFDEYQFGKYDRKTEVSLKDAIFLTHPKPQNEQQDKLFKAIINNTLETPYTWETELSAKGNTAEVWQELIDSKRLGYMATLRNLRNILQAGVSNAHIQKVCDYLSNQKAVEKSRQLPFRFLSAYRELKKVGAFLSPLVLESLEQAITCSASNIKGYDINSTVLIACDVSASMQHPISPKSSVQNFDIGLVLGMLLQSRCKSVISGMFGDSWKVIQLPRNQILSNADEMHSREGEVGYSTNGWKVLEWCIQSEQKIDKIMIFTDCQMWDSTNYHSDNSGMSALWRQYKQLHPNAKLYLFDLAGYGTVPLNIQANDVHLIAGWSAKIFDVLAAINEGQKALEIITNLET